MRLTVERDVILAALSFVQKYAAMDSKIPALADVLIDASGDTVTLTATDLDQAASDTIKADVNAAGSILLSARTLLSAVKSGGGSEVTITADDRQAAISCGRSKFKLPILPGSDFPPMPMLRSDAPTSFTLDTLGNIAGRVLFAAEPDKGRYFLAGVSWRLHEGSIEFVATDGKKFSLLSIPAPSGARGMPSVIVPRFDAPAWTGDVQVSISDLFIRYRCGTQIVASKLIEATYPDYHRMIPKNETSILFDRAELLAAISRMAIIASAGEHSVLFVGRDGKATISARSGDSEASDEVAYHGDDFQIALIHHVIAPILSSFDCETIEWRFASHETGVTIHDPKDDARTAFAMPFRDPRLREFIIADRESVAA
jgi:DNA polymerase-3 subunit beta